MFRPSHGALGKRRGWLPALEWWENRRFLGRTMNFTAKLALVLALLTLPVFGQSTGLPAPGVTAASCASGYFVTGWNATTGVPSCAAGSTGVAPTQRGVNAVADEGFVADNTTDNGPKLQYMGHYHSGKLGVCDDVHSNAVGDDIAWNWNGCSEVALRFGWTVKRC